MVVGAAPELQLDPALKLWVLLPMLIVMIFVGLARHFGTLLLQPSPPQADAKHLREQAYIQYAGTLRNHSFNIGPEKFARYSRIVSNKMREGKYLADPDAKPASGMPSLLDPQGSEMLMGGMRAQVMQYVPQTLVMQWVSAFFGGYVVMKLPFPLTNKFKEMLQANINTQDLDVRWVTSISWYILLLIGLGGVYTLILGSENMAANPATTQGTQAPLMPNVDKKKLFEHEAELLELQRPKSVLTGAQKRVLSINL